MRGTTLERSLGVRFKNRRLMDQALVHPSYVNEFLSDRAASERSLASYQRLEFLGDSVVGVAITLELYHRCPDLPEGQLTKLRSSLVRGRSLAEVARRLELGHHLKLGRGEEASGGRARESNLAATLEAMVGAVFLDRGFDAATKFVLKIMNDDIRHALSQEIAVDPKSQFQEAVQALGGTPPQYRLLEEGGPPHDRSFEVEVLMNGQVMGRGQGRRKLDAENQAAQEALRLMAPDPSDADDSC